MAKATAGSKAKAKAFGNKGKSSNIKTTVVNTNMRDVLSAGRTTHSGSKDIGFKSKGFGKGEKAHRAQLRGKLAKGEKLGVTRTTTIGGKTVHQTTVSGGGSRGDRVEQSSKNG